MAVRARKRASGLGSEEWDVDVGTGNTSLSAIDASPPTAAFFSCCPPGPQPDDRKVFPPLCCLEAAPPCSHGSILSLPGQQPLPPFPLSLLLLSRLEGWFEVAPNTLVPTQTSRRATGLRCPRRLRRLTEQLPSFCSAFLPRLPH